MNRALRVLTLFLLPLYVFAQHTVSGTVTDASTGDALAGANVVVEGTSMGAAANTDGVFTISNVPTGTYSIAASVIGYADLSKSVNVSGDVTVNFVLETSALELTALEVLANRATRNTPVAYSNVSKQDLEFRLGSQDIPMILNMTPSVYATAQGGGAGDARVNIRGFNQRNVAVMINGVPVNDMENGWVYWSNWDGVADATSSIQMQRGLSAVNLATPSIGGTMNIITDPTALKRGGKAKQEFGSGGFLKTTVNYNTGLIGDKMAFSGTVVRKTGDGIIDKAWTDSWAYYFGASYSLNAGNRLEFYALGAPQRHGQMRYKQNIGAFDADFAKSLDDYDEAALETFTEASKDRYDGGDDAEAGRFYNENWNYVDSSYKGKQYFYMYGDKTVDRHDPNFLNESENYYHKPQVSLNWYSTFNDQMRLSSTFYYSGGSGGGTGTFGDLIWDYNGPSRIVDFNETIAINEGIESRKGAAKPAGEAVGYLRNSINRQWTFGAISKLNYDMSDDLKFQVGLDWRTAEIEHRREVRDLLGGDYAVNGKYNNRGEGDDRYRYFYDDGVSTIEAAKVGLGDVINYNYTNTVDWLGFFGQGEYTADRYSLYGMAGFSTIGYSFIDFFASDLELEVTGIGSFQIKGGGLYRFSDEIDIFANFGNVEKPPIFDAVIDDIEGTKAEKDDIINESFVSIEGGLNYRASNGKLNAKINLYRTQWNDRTMTKLVEAGAGSSGDTDVIFLTGLNQLHSGLEAEIAYQPMSMFRLDAALSFGAWEFIDDATGSYKDIANQTSEDYEYAVKGLKVGDMPQTIIALGGTIFPIEGLSIQAILNYYDRHWADWNPLDREVEDGIADREQSWQAPSYSKIDVHAYYNLPINFGNSKLQVFVHVFNLLDEIYVQDALDNSSYNAYNTGYPNYDITNPHKADAAEVYLGTPRYMNAGLSINF